MLNAMVGISVLSLPYAFSLIGTCAGLLALVFVVAVMAHTGFLIGSALELTTRIPELASTPPKSRDFAFLAYAAFGEKGRSLIGLVTGLELWFALVTFMAFNIGNSELLFPGSSRMVTMAFSSALAAATALLPMKVFSQMSMVSSLAVVVMGIAVIAACAASLYSNLQSEQVLAIGSTEDLSEAGSHWWRGTMANAWNLPRSLGIIIFCFAGHPCFAVMHECLRERQEWGRAVNIAFFLSFLYYAGFGCAGSLAFGQSVQPSVVQNLKDEPHAHLCRYIAAAAIVIKVQLTAPLFLNIIRVAIWPQPSPKQDSVEDTFFGGLRHITGLLLMSTMTGAAALVFADKVAALASLAGSLLVMVTSVIFPIIVFQKLSSNLNEPTSWRVRSIHCLLVALGVLMAVVGTIQAAHDLHSSAGMP
jgi:amino acid permease